MAAAAKTGAEDREEWERAWAALLWTFAAAAAYTLVSSQVIEVHIIPLDSSPGHALHARHRLSRRGGELHALSSSRKSVCETEESVKVLKSLKTLPNPEKKNLPSTRRVVCLIGISNRLMGSLVLVPDQVAALKSFPVLSWLGLPAATAWGWEVAPAMGYIGQGMIMGPKTSLSMLGGALLGAAPAFGHTPSGILLGML